MLVKRYVVKEMPEAVAMIREELGKDAVILSTKKVQTRGFLGLFSKTHIEVVAAANEQETKPERPTTPAIPRNAAMGAYQQTRTQTAMTPPTPAPAIPAVLEPIMPPAPMRSPEPASLRQAQPTLVAPEFPLIKRADEPPVNLPLAVPQERTTATPNAVAAPDVLKEVQELRALIRSFITTPTNQLMPEAVRKIREQLLDNDLEIEFVDVLIERGIRHFQQVKDIDEQEFRGILTNFIKEELEQSVQPSQLALTTRIAAFIGPTGVGKTTTIAKLAAEQVLTHGKKVGFITTDTYRISAVEQLRTYANILNVPLEVCYSPEDTKRAMEKFADLDLVLVDTAGRNYGNELNVKELNSYLQVLQPDETYLVLALTTKASDLSKIVNNFKQVSIDKFLFTKADETNSFGAVYNLVSRYKIPLSYLTIGQNVPDDIEVVSIGKLSSLLVGEHSYA